MESLLFPILSLGGLGLVFGIVLGVASKKLSVEVNPLIPLVRAALPSANCGGCGFAGCDAYAEAVVSKGAPLNSCTVGGSQVAEKLGVVMGVTVKNAIPKKAYVKCQGSFTKAKQKYEYEGPRNCLDASNLPGGGPKACMYGCLGMGSCVKVCAFDSIHIVNGIAVVDETTCTGCGLCVKTCPKNIIELLPLSKAVRVTCSSKLKGVLDVKINCSVGCIACGLCEKSCPKGAIELVHNLPVINYDKCVHCGICVKKCPTKAIVNLQDIYSEKN